MQKYRIGLGVIALITVGFVVLTLFQGSTQKQDKTTYKKALEISKELNKYISKNSKIPDNLDALDIKDVPPTIKFTKESESTYKICEKYNKKSSYGGNDIFSLLWGSSLSNYDDSSQYDYDYGYESEYKPSTYYPKYSHDKGDNCQTIEPYNTKYNLYNYNQTPVYTPSTPSTSSNKNDTERQTDIKALHGAVEAYYAQNGNYPTLADLNNPSFRATNLKGLDIGALEDPVGKVAKLVSYPTKNKYSYEVKASDGGSCDNSTYECVSYTLTATLESGGKYTKASLN